MKKIAISVGDLNGIGIELILKNHKKISKICNPIYCINKDMLKKASKLLNIKIPDINIYPTKGEFTIKPGKISKKSGLYSYNSFLDALTLAIDKKVDGIVTMPINKSAWQKAKIKYKGHTEVLRDKFNKAIMMLGYEKLFVALYTEHIALKDVNKYIKKKHLIKFFLDFYNNIQTDKIAVLGLNPHLGDNGFISNEDKIIKKAIEETNKILNKQIFFLFVPDVAFCKDIRKEFKYYIAMYHDQGLIPLKALYFEESINVSLNIPIIRTSPDHGTAFDKAYKDEKLSNKSYLNCINYIIKT